jgi:hypothetical protein
MYYIGKLDEFSTQMEELEYYLRKFLEDPAFQSWIDRIEDHGGGGTGIIGQYVDNMQEQCKTLEQLHEHFYGEVNGMKMQVTEDPLGHKFSGTQFRRPFFRG